MQLSDLREYYNIVTEKASSRARELSFAGIALVWLFKSPGPAVASIPSDLLIPAALFVGALGLDLLHAMYASLLWGAYNRYYEKRLKEDDEFEGVHPVANWPTIAFFWGKLACVFAGYLAIFNHMFRLFAAR
ncbi:hypothetical protein QLQ15_13230 [Lysobacter sp. LF1]|uniref:Uncharacterized protein n=1 Tax=Lysobacter stagni TaxID=3045172 RepID=A0ABT6XIR6_9GAMM|nr:hypothetical protein [Lysobacter sp. LF1]MDI9239868.1 hypothetical protein [Lysobacter sp. LF1]